MSYSKYYNPTNWENYPSEDTAVNAMHLNNLEDGVDTLDDRIVALSTDKSEVSWNQTLISGEKIAEITVNGITKDVYAPEISDSVVEQAAEQALKSEGYAVGTQGDVPVTSGLYYHNNSKYYSEQASDSASDASASAVEAGQSADDAEEEALVSEGWANGKQNGVPVEEGSPYYHNNAEYWKDQANPTRLASLTDVDFGTLKDDEIIVYDTTSQKFKNEVGVSAESKNATIASGAAKFNTRTGGILQSCVVDLEPIQSGSGTPSPSNVRPITGHTSVKVGNVGKNRLPLTVAFMKSINTSGTWSENNYSVSGLIFSLITDSDNNVISVKVTGTASATVMFVVGNFTDTRYDFILNGCPSSGSGSTYNLTPNGSTPDIGEGISVPTSSSWNGYVSIYVYNNYACPSGGLLFKPMLRLATDTDATFAPYQGQDITINLGGTYYGGSLDAVSGVLTVDKGGVDLGSLTWEKHSEPTYWFRATLTGLKAEWTTVMNGACEIYKPSSGSLVYTGNADKSFGGNPNTLYIYDSSKTSLDATAFKTSVTGYKLVYELATPLTIQLTPQQIETLIGENHLDIPLTGQSLDSLSYREMMAWDDVEKAINVKLDLSSVAPIEYTDKASQPYNQKQLFIKDNKLCQALTSISSDASFTENTNFKYTTLAEIIEPLIP